MAHPRSIDLPVPARRYQLSFLVAAISSAVAFVLFLLAGPLVPFGTRATRDDEEVAPAQGDRVAQVARGHGFVSGKFQFEEDRARTVGGRSGGREEQYAGQEQGKQPPEPSTGPGSGTHPRWGSGAGNPRSR